MRKKLEKTFLFFVMSILFIFGAFYVNIGVSELDLCHIFNSIQVCDIAGDLNKVARDRLEDLNSTGFEDLLSELGDDERAIFGGDDFKSELRNLLNGKGGTSFTDLMGLIVKLILKNFSMIIPLFACICAIAIVSSILLQIRGKSLNKPLGDIIHFACYMVIAVIVLNGVVQLVSITRSTLVLLKKQMDIAFPILLTIMTSLGANMAVGIYQPIVAILCGAIMQLFTNIILPIFSFCLIFSVIGGLSSSVKLSKISNFFRSLFKYIIGFTFTLFSGFLAISGVVAGSYDGISIRATKYAVKSYIPIMGGYLADGFNLIMASGVLIKNAIGYSGLVIMFLTIISPLLKIVLYKLGLSLVAGIIEPIADERVTRFISDITKNLSMLSSIILAFSFAYLICVGLMMCSSNVI